MKSRVTNLDQKTDRKSKTKRGDRGRSQIESRGKGSEGWDGSNKKE